MTSNPGGLWEEVGGGRMEGATKPAGPPCCFATFIVAFLICMQRDLDSIPVGLSVVSADSAVRENTHMHAKPQKTHTHNPPLAHWLVEAKQ